METFDTQIFGYLYIKYGIVFYKICVIQFYNIFLVVPSQNTTYFSTKVFSCYLYYSVKLGRNWISPAPDLDIRRVGHLMKNHEPSDAQSDGRELARLE